MKKTALIIITLMLCVSNIWAQSSQARQQSNAARQQTNSTRQQSNAARQQSNAARQQSNAARQTLDKTAATIRSAGDIRADFSATSTSGSLSGTVYIQKNKLVLTSQNVKCWFDGKTLWTYNKHNNEVNITTPTVAEQQSINPYLFLNIYKNGYKCSQKEVKIGGKDCYEVTLTATSAANKLKSMVVCINKSNHYPISVKMNRQKGSTTIYITNCKTHQKFKASTFRFNAKECAGAEIIDLR